MHQVDRHVSLLPGMRRCPVHEAAVRRALRAARDVQQGGKVPVHQRLLRPLLRLQVPWREDAHRENEAARLGRGDPGRAQAGDRVGQRVRRVGKAREAGEAEQAPRLPREAPEVLEGDGKRASPGSQAAGEGRCEDAQGE